MYHQATRREALDREFEAHIVGVGAAGPTARGT